MNHCNERGSEIYCGDDSHIVQHEQGGPAQIAGVTVCQIPNYPDGTYDLDELETKFRIDRLHEPISKLVTAENTIGGKVVPQDWLDRLCQVARDHGLKSHLDGARLFNASVASGLPVDRIVRDFDSVTFCLSKGLSAPVGSVLCGSQKFVQRARRIKKVLGGGLRQCGILAAAGLVALDEIVPLLKYDHERAFRLATAINEAKSPLFSVDLKTTQTNMVQMKMTSKQRSSIDFVERLQKIESDQREDQAIVRAFALTKTSVRFVIYHQVTDELIDLAIMKIKYLIKDFTSKE